jgi:hypothetical protein
MAGWEQSVIWEYNNDYELIQSWEGRLIPEVLIDTAFITENWQLDQREGYITTLEDGSYENDFDALHKEAEPGTVIGGSFLSDEEGQNKNRQMAFVAKLRAGTRTRGQLFWQGTPYWILIN